VSGRARAATFTLLVVATFAAFFVVQRIKREPSDVRGVRATDLFSPNRDGRLDRARASFRLERGDTVTVRVVDDDFEPVRTLVRHRALPAGRRLRFSWNGRTEDGRRAPDGVYRYRVNLQDQGRAVLLPRLVRLDTKPPEPRVLSIGPAPTKPEILPLPDGGPARIRFDAPSATEPTEVLIYRTSPGVELVGKTTVPAGQDETTWDGTRDGRRLRPGTYVVALRTRDQAGNIGSSPAVLPPRPRYGLGLGGNAGITIRYLGAQPTLEPTIAGSAAQFGVDARRQPYRWSIRRVGVTRVVKEGRKTKPVVTFDAPDDRFSGLYLFEARSGGRVTQVPFPVQAVKTRKVLVVLPAILWQGRNPVDDDGDGWPNTLTAGLAVRRERVLADGLPGDLVKQIAPLLIFLDRQGLRYDLTTDLALAAGVGPRLDGHTGVMLAGDERWLPAAQQLALRHFVRRGGTVASFGVDSLRRQVRLTPETIADPTAPTGTDAFGATLRPLEQRPDTTLTIFEDEVELFAGDVYGGTGVFAGYDVFEETAAVGSDAKIVASAVTDDGRKVIVATRLGKGLVIRFGLPQLPERLGAPGNETELVRRTWTLLSR
jgi:hypothetical protein